MKYVILLNMKILKKLKKIEIINIFIILTKKMVLEMKNKDIYQVLGTQPKDVFLQHLDDIDYMLFQDII